MAERRMFAKTIIDSDAFLDMPLSAQALYFHLSMRADDEGFINNPKKIQRMIGASDDDAKLLIAKKFIIPFETGVVVIKHWRIHNYIRPDRLVPTKYQEERGMLDVKDNGTYTIAQEIAEIESLDAKDIRKLAYKNSSLPYSFDYKIRRAFDGKVCPVCGSNMSGAYKNRMPTVQHNIPISRGGEHELENISVICHACNCSIQDNPTDELNNSEVREMWDRIVAAENQGIDWFYHPENLMSVKCPSSVSQWTVNGPSMDGIGKDRLGKDRLGKDRLDIDAPTKARRFKPPTVEEVREYCTERNNRVDPERFVDYYTACGWVQGKGKPIKDWKAAVRNWERNEKPSQVNIAQQAAQERQRVLDQIIRGEL